MPKSPIAKDGLAETTHEAFRCICAHENITLAGVYKRLLELLEGRAAFSNLPVDLKYSSVKELQNGRGILNEDEIAAVAELAIWQGYLTRRWLHDFLRATQAHARLRDQLESEFEHWVWRREEGITENEAFDITFNHRQIARGVYAAGRSQLRRALSSLGLELGQPAVILIGGASGLDEQEDLGLRVRKFLLKGLVPTLIGRKIAGVDGATQYGLFKLLGELWTTHKCPGPLIGVAPRIQIALPRDRLPLLDRSALNPDHTHFVFTPGAEWDAASPYIADTGNAIAEGMPVIAILINGGRAAWTDAWDCMWAGIPVIAVQGSGRTADHFASAVSRLQTNPRARTLRDLHLAQSITLDQPKELARRIEETYAATG